MSTKNLKYPKDIDKSNLSSLLFMAKEYTSVASNRHKISEITQKDIQKSPLGSVLLYMPQFSESFNTTWDFTLDFVDSLVHSGQKLIRGAVKNTVQKTNGIATANNEMSTFTDISNRTYNFSFTFFPKSKEEATEISEIINFFRYHSMPDYGDRATVKIPTVFEIKASGLKNSFKNTLMFKPMVLNSVNVTYGKDDHVQLMSDGAISDITLSLNLTEIFKPLKSDFKDWNK